MASMYTDFMPLRQSVEVPSDHSGEHNLKERTSSSVRSSSSRSRTEENHTIEVMEEGDPPLKDNCGSDRLHDLADSTIALSSTNKVAGFSCETYSRTIRPPRPPAERYYKGLDEEES
jgi:hypothetical protein